MFSKSRNGNTITSPLHGPLRLYRFEILKEIDIEDAKIPYIRTSTILDKPEPGRNVVINHLFLKCKLWLELKNFKKETNKYEIILNKEKDCKKKIKAYKSKQKYLYEFEKILIKKYLKRTKPVIVVLKKNKLKDKINPISLKWGITSKIF